MEVTGAFWSGRASLPVEGKWGVGRKGGGGVEAVTPQVCGLARKGPPPPMASPSLSVGLSFLVSGGQGWS